MITNADDQVGVDRSTSMPKHAEPTLRLRGVGRRFGGLHAVRDVDLDVAPRRAPGDPRAERRRQDDALQRHLRRLPRRPRARSSSSAGTSRTLPARKRAKLGLARTYQQSRIFCGLTVEDNIYLSILGVARRPPAAGRPRRKDRRAPRAGARRLRGASRSTTSSRELVGVLSHGEHRQVALAMALAAEPKILMLDEPAPGSPAASASC